MLDFQREFLTEKIYLRPLRISDFEEMFNLTQVPDMWIYFTSDLSKEKELKIWIEKGIKDDSRLALSVIDRSSGVLMGSTSIANYSMRDKRAEIGWTWMGKPFQGTGHNAKVKGVLLKYLFEDCELERVEWKTDVLNTPARNALLKMGCIEEGVLRSHTQMIRNRRRDTIYYSILKSEWEGIKAKNHW